MAIKYYKLMDVLRRLGMSKGEFGEKLEFSSGTVAKLSTNRPVNMEIIDRICKELDLQPGDIMEYVDEDDNKGD